MPVIERSVRIEAPVEDVYRISQDYDVRYEWDPFPEKISVVAGSAGGLSVGTQVLVRSKLGMEMLVEFVQVALPRRAAIMMLSGPPLLEKFAGSWIFEPLDGDATLARFRYTIATRPKWLAWIGDRVAMVYFSRTIAKRLAGLKRYCENRRQRSDGQG
jgi:hypothetical protein